jgi:NAD(P)-binding Rossmann-like domain
MVTSVDRQALRRKYAEERDKRLRPDGNDQYLRISDEFAHYLDDPYTPWTERAPRTDHRTVVCVGGGFAGLVVGARLRQAGVDVAIIEKGGDFGGTWYRNRYPGAQCDTAACGTRIQRASSRRGIASCASGPAFTTSTCRPSTTRTRTWSTPTAGE